MSAQDHLNPQQFYHGTAHAFKAGDLIEPGHGQNFAKDDSAGHVYFAERPKAARIFALQATAVKGTQSPHVYVVEPTGPHEPDPEMADKDIQDRWGAGYRSQHPLRVVKGMRRPAGGWDQ